MKRHNRFAMTVLTTITIAMTDITSYAADDGMAGEPATEQVTTESTTNIADIDFVTDNSAETLCVATVEPEEVKPSFQGMELRFSEEYPTDGPRMTPKRGVLMFNGHRETYYSQKVLPGGGLDIPGRHVADDGTVRDGDGFIVVAADFGFMPRGTELMTSLGPARVYDTGCVYGTIDIYVNW